MKRLAAVVSLVAVCAGLAACKDGTTTTGTPATAAPATATTAEATPSPSGLPGKILSLTLTGGQPITLVGGGAPVGFGTAGANDLFGVPAPDGKHLALISGSTFGAPGDLVVVAAGGQRRVLAKQVEWSGGQAPVWTPDGTAVIVAGTRYLISDGSHTDLGLAKYNSGYLTYSVDGATRAYATTEHSVAVSAADGSNTRTIDLSNLPDCERTATCPFAIQSVTPDGTYLAVGSGNTDPSHVSEAHVIVDGRNGQPVELKDLRTIKHIWFTAAGGAIIDTGDGLRLTDKNWKVIGTFPAPPAGALFYTA